MNGISNSAEVKEAVSVARNRRTDAMFAAAFGAVLWFIYLVVYEPIISEYAQGVLTLALGNFIGYLTAMYNYETGTTRGTQAKDTTIKNMAESAAGVQVADTIKADNLKVSAEKVTVHQPSARAEPAPLPIDTLRGGLDR